VVGAVFHAPGGAGGTDRALAGERDQPLETTGGAANSPETSGQGSAIDVSAQLALDKGRQAAAVGAALASSGKEVGRRTSRDDSVSVHLDGVIKRRVRVPPYPGFDRWKAIGSS
jgi:hypothetical protein